MGFEYELANKSIQIKSRKLELSVSITSRLSRSNTNQTIKEFSPATITNEEERSCLLSKMRSELNPFDHLRRTCRQNPPRPAKFSAVTMRSIT